MQDDRQLTLYHSVESTCAQKVRLVLTSKGISWKENLLNLRKGEQFTEAYLKLNPKAVVPTLVHGDRVIRESTVINEYLDDTFTNPSLKPEDTFARAMMRLIVKMFDDDVHPAIGILTYAIVMRHQMMQLKSPQELEAHFEKITDPGRRERQERTHHAGLESEYALQAIQALDRTVAYMQTRLAGNNWLCGDRYSLADAAAAPYMVRAARLGLGALWRDRPAIAPWLERVCGLDNCRNTPNPWGTEAFTETLEHYAAQSTTQIEALMERAS